MIVLRMVVKGRKDWSLAKGKTNLFKRANSLTLEPTTQKGYENPTNTLSAKEETGLMI